jgi:hypothetical protein
VAAGDLLDLVVIREVRRGPQDEALDMLAGPGWILPRADAARLGLLTDLTFHREIGIGPLHYADRELLGIRRRSIWLFGRVIWSRRVK